jgi:predicted MFS family arabinose efflux permease
VRTQALGWGSVEVIASLAAGVALLAAFVVVELRAESPLVPMKIFRPHGMRSSTVALSLNGAVFLGMFFLTALFLQEVRGKSALDTGLELLPMGVAAILAAVAASSFVARIGTRTIQIVGGALSVAGLLLLSRAGADGAYVSSLLPGLVLFGAGLVSVGVASQIAAVAEVSHDESGAASAIINTAYQVGGALGLAVITTLADSHVKALTHGGLSAPLALTGGFQRGLIAAAILALVNLVLALGAPQIRPNAEILAAAAAG